MPVIVDPDSGSVRRLLGALPPGCQSVDSIERLLPWLSQHSDEYVIVLGPNVRFDDAVTVCEGLRVSRPMMGVVLVRESFDTQTLARAMQAGAREVVAINDLDSIAGAVTRAHQFSVALRGPGQAEHQGSVIAVFSPKGGVGKTTIAVNLALALTDKGSRQVCLVDFDLAFGDVAITLQLFPEHTIADAVAMQADLDAESLDGLLTKYSENLCALVAPTTPLAKATITQELVGKILTSLKQRFDYVVVDTPPAFDDVVLQAFDASDLLLLVLTLDIPALKNIKVTLETLELLNFPREKCRIVLNRADAKVGLTLNEVETTLHSDIAASIASAREVPASVNRGEPIVIALPRHPVSQTFMTLARDCVAAIATANVRIPVTAGEAAQSDGAGRRRRLLRRGSRHG